MTDTSHGTGGLTFDKSKRSWPNEINIFIALILIIVIFEVLGQLLPYMNNQSFLFDTQRTGSTRSSTKRGCRSSSCRWRSSGSSRLA